MQANFRFIKDLSRGLDMWQGRQGAIDIEVRENGKIFQTFSQRVYIPSPTCVLFHADKTSRTKIIMGPYASGKTSAICHEILLQAMRMPPCKDGVRRCKVAIIRNVLKQLRQTTQQTWLTWMGRLGTISKVGEEKPVSTTHRFKDRDGAIELVILWLALDRESDIEDLQSLELSHAFFNEVQHVPKIIFDHVDERLGRYPDKSFLTGSYRPVRLADTNPPRVKSWLYEFEKQSELMTIDDPAKITFFHQQPAILKSYEGIEEREDYQQLRFSTCRKYYSNPLGENIEHLTEGYQYYFNNIHKGEEFVRVYCQGHYGTVVDGKPVFPQYNDDLHSVNDIDVNLNYPLILGWDFGKRCPACVAMQYVDGQVRVIREFFLEYRSVTELAKLYVLPFLVSLGPNLRCEHVGDPANTAGGIEQLRELKIYVKQARTNNIGLRLEGIIAKLNTLNLGKAGFIISKKWCAYLRDAFLGEYHYKTLYGSDGERYTDMPDKVNPYADLVDCVQYGILELSSVIDQKKPMMTSFSNERFRTYR
jgi:hypothetical protein